MSFRMQGLCARTSNLDFILQTSGNLCHLLSREEVIAAVLEGGGSGLDSGVHCGGREACKEAGVANEARGPDTGRK